MPRPKGTEMIAFRVVVTVPTFERLTAKARVSQSGHMSLSARNKRPSSTPSAGDYSSAITLNRTQGREEMRSTHACMLHGQLLVDRSAVSRITAEPHRVPHNTVSVVLINRRTGEQSTRNLRWDEQVTTRNRSRSRSRDRQAASGARTAGRRRRQADLPLASNRRLCRN
jgi:hypothetical protein